MGSLGTPNPLEQPKANPLFRRTKSADAAVPAQTPSGKGRPTPSRREAQAAAKARARQPKSRKEAARLQRQRRGEQNARMRQGLKSGDERFLPARDKGKVRRFVRDRVDSQLRMAEFLLPMLLVIMVLAYSGSERLQGISNGLWTATIFVVILDTLYIGWRIKRDVRARFPEESTKGLTFYAIMRSLQIRFMRLPKPNVKLGQRLPDRY